MSREPLPPLTRTEVRALLAHYRVTGLTPPTDAQVSTWLRELAGHSAGECHAALTALQAHHHGRITPDDVVRRIAAARAAPAATGSLAPVVPIRRRDRRERAAAMAAGARGIAAVYAAMGWQRNPDHAAARRVPCPFCKARPGEVCSPLTRDRAGRREHRDRATRMHPSRLAAAPPTRPAAAPTVETTR
ncbi:zinc finger domain-containing protein [Actinokineospora iranica]|uniref:DNA-binding phage zinc finger domain-containing protein n=1 Tax=Actinokineospora iranica TaxID=1271860 RepID=A0A1G6K2M4_9PSEU|nr:hypothetical protein [Actinokineospora iranica]SDC25183.1 hypothetical protein SAMN05216174_101681 [Actinokineospora iranica]